MTTSKRELIIWEEMLHADILSMEPLAKGRNSRVWRVTAATGQLFAAKEYFRSPHDPRDRLLTEWTALTFLHAHGIDCVPQAVACDHRTSRALYSFVEGESPLPCGHQATEVLPLVDFACQLYDMRHAGLTAQLPRASEACFSLKEIFLQLEHRFAYFASMPTPNAPSLACKQFVDDQLQPALKASIQHAHKAWATAALDEEQILSPTLLMPSPSDFGFHNALRQPNGTFCFVDFEYFGMDDPAKLLADVCLHPAMRLNAAQKTLFTERILQYIAPLDSTVALRFKVCLPLWRLKWCAILLNEFLPQQNARRAFAGAKPEQHCAKLQQQLAKAQLLLEEHHHDTQFS